MATIKPYFSNIPISLRLVIPAIITYVLFCLVFFWVIVPSFEDIVMEQKKDMVRERTNFAWGIIRQFDREFQEGEFTLEEAQENAKRFLEYSQYGKDNLDYFWINDNQPKFIMHPYAPELIGIDIGSIENKNIRDVLDTINRITQSSSEGFLTYDWQWQNDPHDITEKVSYVKEFKPWGWTVGTGIYIKDMNREIALLKDRFNLSAGIILFLIGFMLIITVSNSFIEENQKSRAKKELLASEKKYRQLVQSANSIILRLDIKGRITFFNKFAQDFFGYQENHILGNSIVGTILAPSESSSQMLNEILENPEKYGNIEVENIRSDGDMVKIFWTVKALYDDNGALREFLCIGNDVTELRKIEETYQKQKEQLIQADKMASLGILVSGVAHEINNPNHYIMGNTSVLKGIINELEPVLDHYHQMYGEYQISGIPYEQLHEQIIEMLADIHTGSDRIRHIVQELRDFARIQHGELIESIDFNAIIKSAIILTANMIKKSTHNFSVTYGAELPLSRGNFQRLEQVMINLIQNACQALENPSQGIRIFTEYSDDRIVCVVKDEGSGINEDILKHITDPFFTTKRDTGGTGLGLSISSRIISEHGGTMTFMSSPGTGTEVTISLPITDEKTELTHIGISDYIDTSSTIRMDKQS